MSGRVFVTKFNWHAEYFDDLTEGSRSIRRAIIKADNADEAEKIAKDQMGECLRVEVRRAATTAPVRTIYARAKAGVKILSPTDLLSLAPARRAPTLT
jgi:hypothetical protein